MCLSTKYSNCLFKEQETLRPCMIWLHYFPFFSRSRHWHLYLLPFRLSVCLEDSCVGGRPSFPGCVLSLLNIAFPIYLRADQTFMGFIFRDRSRKHEMIIVEQKKTLHQIINIGLPADKDHYIDKYLDICVRCVSFFLYMYVLISAFLYVCTKLCVHL